MDEITKDVREGGVKELLYADGLVLYADTWKEIKMDMHDGKKTVTEKGFKVNVNKTKAFCTGEKTVAMARKHAQLGGVGRNSILCIKCVCLVHKRCFGVQKCLSMAVDFVYRKYSGFT